MFNIPTTFGLTSPCHYKPVQFSRNESGQQIGWCSSCNQPVAVGRANNQWFWIRAKNRWRGLQNPTGPRICRIRPEQIVPLAA